MKTNLKKPGIILSVLALAIMLFSFTPGKSDGNKLGVTNEVSMANDLPMTEDPSSESLLRALLNGLKAATPELEHLLLMASTTGVVDEETLARVNRMQTRLMSKL